MTAPDALSEVRDPEELEIDMDSQYVPTLIMVSSGAVTLGYDLTDCYAVWAPRGWNLRRARAPFGVSGRGRSLTRQ